MADCRFLTLYDVKSAAQIEESALTTAWSEKQIEETLGNENALYLVAKEDGNIVGIASAYNVLGDAEILNIAVKEEYRGRKIGKLLLNSLIGELKSRNASRITLEVAEDNERAISLYEKNGFEPVYRRKNFYRGKDAIVMEMVL